MRITKVTLSNFGPHTRGLLDTDAALVGLVGPNGSGKSNVMSAIEWALTSQLADNAAEYIKDFDPNKRQPAAKVEVEFWHQGVSGKITRSVSKSGATRELHYDGKVSTSEAEVESRLCALYGEVPLRTISDVGFIAQDEMQHLLFGLQSEREKMFVKLFGLAHTDKVAQILQDEIRLLRSSITDRSAQISTVEQMLSDTRKIRDEKSVDILSKCLVDTSPRVAELKQWIEFKKTWIRLSDALAKASDNCTTSVGAFGKLTATLTPDKVGREINLSSLRNMIATAQSSLRDRQNAAAAITAALGIVSRAKKCLLDAAHVNRSLSESEGLLTGFMVPLSDEVDAFIDSNVYAVNKVVAIRLAHENASLGIANKRASIAQKETRMNGIISAEAKLHADLESAEACLQRATEECKNLQHEIALAEASKAQLQGVEKVMATLDHTHGDGCSQCPVCHGDLNPEKVRSVDDIRTEIKSIEDNIRCLRARMANYSPETDRLVVSNLSKTLSENAATIEVLRDLIAAEKSAIDEMEAAQSSRIAELEELQGKLSAPWTALANSDTRADTIRRLTLALSEWKSSKARQAYVNSDLTQALDELVASGYLSADKKKADSLEIMESSLNDLQSDLEAHSADPAADTLREQIRSLEAKAAIEESQIKALETRLATGMADMNSASQIKAQAEQAFAAHAGTVPSDHWVFSTPMPDIESSLAFAEEARDKYIAARAELKALDDQAVRQEAEIENLRSLDQMDQSKRDLATKLEHLQGWFKREGLPLHYVQRRFDQITQLTNMSLEVMGSNFRVAASTEKPVTFLFSRTDRADGAEVMMAQNRLSGGQRVRLSIAFLIGFHELIIPGFGLLSLDEPSLHLDNDSVNDLRDLLVTLGRQIEGVGRQIILCDHNPHLVSACEKVIAIPQGGLNH